MIRQYLFILVSLTFFSSCSDAPQQASLAKKDKGRILIIGTNTDTFNHGANGTYFIEIAPPYTQFTENGYLVDIVTPKGGKLALYGEGSEQELTPDFSAEILNTLRPGEMDVTGYAAIFIPGGYGQFIDVCNNPQMAELIAKAYESGALLGATGHGPASLVSVKLSNGSFLVTGKSMTCFPTQSEHGHMTVSSYGKALPFDMEKELRARGAILVYTHDDVPVEDLPNRMITCAYAEAAEKVAARMVEILDSSNK